jgi:type IV secretion system protein VirB11
MSCDEALGRDASVQHHLRRYQLLLDDPTITEIAINGPDRICVERNGCWEETACQVSATELRQFGIAVARYSDQQWSAHHPLLSATVPYHGSVANAPALELRLQLVGPPAVAFGQYAFVIRKPAPSAKSLIDFADSGFFGELVASASKQQQAETMLQSLYQQHHISEFLVAAVRQRKNIVVSGATGSGKTTFMKALLLEIPRNQRLITIEDARELSMPHPNTVHLLYSKGSQSSSEVGPRDLLEACFRMKPDRILLAELRGDEALYYIRSAASGHPGSITTVHAGTCAVAFEQMAIMIKDSRGGASLDFETIHRLLRLTIDVVVQLQNDGTQRWVSEIYFRPPAAVTVSA